MATTTSDAPGRFKATSTWPDVTMKKMAEDRNAIVAKYNKTVEEFNDLVKKWNDQQTMLAAAATNTPAPPKK